VGEAYEGNTKSMRVAMDRERTKVHRRLSVSGVMRALKNLREETPAAA